MITAVCLNAALDVTYHVDELVPGRSHRTCAGHVRAGGKGLNVARVLHQLGVEVRVAGFAGGPAGELIRADLAALDIPTDLVAIAGESRRCTTLVDPADATVLNEPGPTVTSGEWAELLAAAGNWGGEVVVLSGSVPPGVPRDAYARLVTVVHRSGARTVVDADGPALLAALDAGPDVVTPNASEAAAALGRPVTSVADAVAAGRRLRELGARAAVLSRGADGLVAVTDDGTWTAGVPVAVTGNPTGAGDALAAALARGLAAGTSWPDVLRDGVATAGSAVAVAQAGEVDAAVRAELLASAVVDVPVRVG